MKPVHFFVALAVLPVTACHKEAAAPPFYQVAPVQRRTLELSVAGEGTIRPIDSVRIRSKTAGEVTRVFVSVGDKVERGQPLLAIDARVPRANAERGAAALAAARVGLVTAEAGWTRARALFASQALTQAELDSIAVARQMARAAVVRGVADSQNANIALEDARIESPIAGIVLAVHVNAGKVITATTRSIDTASLVVIGRMDSVEVVGLVSETEIGGLSRGMPAQVAVDAYPNRTFDGTITRIEPQATMHYRATWFPVHVRLPNPERLLKPGMNATITIETGLRQGVLAVPYAALRTVDDARSAAELIGLPVDWSGVSARGTSAATSAALRAAPLPGRRRPRRLPPRGQATAGREFLVFTRANQQIEVTPVHTGVSDGGWAEIRSGLEEQDTVMILPSQSLLDNLARRRQRLGRMGLPGMKGR